MVILVKRLLSLSALVVRVKLDSISLWNQLFSKTTVNEDDVACEFGLLKGVVRQLLGDR